MSKTDDLYERLAGAASLEGPDAALRIIATYEPSAGPDAKVFPPSYPRPGGQRGESVYLLEPRYRDGQLVDCVLLDAHQSQANRCEEALAAEVSAGRLDLPRLQLDVDAADTRLTITSLDAPHRSRDAYFRDSQVPGLEPPVAFDDTEIGRALAVATERQALAYYRHAPVDSRLWLMGLPPRRPTRDPLPAYLCLRDDRRCRCSRPPSRWSDGPSGSARRRQGHVDRQGAGVMDAGRCR